MKIVFLINNILKILGKKWQLLFFMLFPLNILRSLIDVIGVSLIAPLIAITTNPENVLDNELFKSINFFQISTPLELITMAAVAIFLFYLFKFLYSLLVIHLNSYLFFRGRAFLSAAVLESYLKASWAFHLSHNSSLLDSRIRFECSKAMSSVANLLKFFNEVFFILFSCIVLALSNFMITSIIISVFIILFGGWIFFTKSKINDFGHSVISSQAETGKNLREAFDSLKEINIYSLSKFFQKRYLRAHLSNGITNAKQAVLSSVPPFFVELLVMTFLSVVCFVIIQQEMNIIEIAPVLGLFGLILVRMMPYASNISRTIQSIQFESPALDLIWGDLNIEENTKKTLGKPLDFKSISVNDVSFSYGPKEILTNLNFEINKGELFGVFGDSGSGKTTLINLLTGLLDPSSGKILVNNFSLNEVLQEWHSSIAYLGQEVLLIDASVKENIAFGLEPDDIDIELINHVIEKTNLTKFISGLSEGIESNIGERGQAISGGQKQRIALARALYRKPKILILDEFTSALDQDNEEIILKSISDVPDITIIIISHSLRAKHFCQKNITLTE